MPELNSKVPCSSRREVIVGMPTGFDPKLAARLSKLGPVAVPRPAAKIPAKVYIRHGFEAF